ncbi:MAG: glutathione S-transferase [Pseudobdellovibrio sp.]|jgi:glutathione S-transferase|nr:glutathione S-transferase [Pseudobdellovibrio sp.]
MTQFLFGNPVFVTYVIAASIMILKAIGMSWLTVARMIKVNGGFRAPEDIRKTLLNPNPSAEQVKPNEYVERVRRIHQNDLENIPFFLFAGLLFVFTGPSLLTAQILMYGYVISRFVHFYVYLNEFTHDTRAACWTPGSLILIYMSVRTLVFAVAGI